MKQCGKVLTALLAALGLWAAAAQTNKQASATPLEQPIPFNHKVHAGTLKLKCKMCHVNAEPGEIMGIVGPATCMQCHTAIKTESPSIQKLAAFAKNGREIRWARVYEIPAFVIFSHKAHLQAGNTCQECHGAVRERDQLYREADLSMGGCMNCHRAKKASIDCTYCHEQQQER